MAADLKNTQKIPEPPAFRVAYGYMRVSSNGQTTERQEATLDSWLRAHSDYELKDLVVQHVSGRKKGRLDWFFKTPTGSVLVVEDLDRFSRLSITDGVDLLHRIFKSGRFIAVCSHRVGNGDIIRNWNGRGVARSLIDEFDRAREESERKRERSNGAVRSAYEIFKEKNFAHPKCPLKPRLGNKKVHYPFWLDLDLSGNNGYGEFETNKNVRCILRAFELSLDPNMGEDLVMAQLIKEGFRSLSGQKKGQKLSGSTIGGWLKNRQVLGEHQMTVVVLDEFGEPIKERVPYGDVLHLFPAIISPKDFERVQQLRKERGKKPENTSCGGKVGSLFQGHQFCAQCGGSMGLKGQIDGYDARLRCSVGKKDIDKCHVIGENGEKLRKGATYNELEILNSILDIEWESLFGNHEHEAKLREWTATQQKAYAKYQEAEEEVKLKKDSIRKSFSRGEKIPDFLITDLQEAEALCEKERELYNKATADLQTLSSRPSGKEAAKNIKDRVSIFIDEERIHPDEEQRIQYRTKFNQWLKSEGIVLLVDVRTGKCEVGRGTVETVGRTHTLVEFDQSLNDAVGLGLNPAEAKAWIQTQSKSEPGIGNTTVTMSPGSPSQSRPTHSDWPQPEKAWGHVDRFPLKAITVHRKAANRRSKKPN